MMGLRICTEECAKRILRELALARVLCSNLVTSNTYTQGSAKAVAFALLFYTSQHPLPLLLTWLFLLLHRRKPKLPDLFAQRKVFAVGEGGKVGALHAQFALVVEQLFIGADGDDVGDEHIVRAQRDDVGHAALQRKRALGDGGAGDLASLLACQAALGEFIHLGARIHAAIVGGADEVGRGEVEGEFTALLDDLIGMALWANGNVGLGRVGVENTRPGDCDDIALFHRPAADHDGRQGAEQRRALPLNLSHRISSASDSPYRPAAE